DWNSEPNADIAESSHLWIDTNYGRASMRVLVTGFRSKESTGNASEVLVTSLMDDLPAGLARYSENIRFSIVQDDTETIKAELSGLLERICPNYCVFVGQAPGRNSVCLENFATNYRVIGAALKTGEAPPGDMIETSGPAAYAATLPDLTGMVRQLKTAGIPAAVSYSCGNNLCNQLLYLGLHRASEFSLPMKCGFVHIPALPEQVILQWPQHPFMPLQMTRKSIEIILNHLLMTSLFP
ncbi:MAG: hypothetical protein Q8P24_18365, partial [Desulfobacterales bacterium]|nr:hypothetical protein [Desulfobacterales bacterium]